MTSSSRVRFLGCPLDLLGHAQLRQQLIEAMAGGERVRVEGLNVAKLIDARKDMALRRALEAAEIVHVDGYGVSLGLSWLGFPDAPRWAGIDLMQELCAEAARTGVGIYLLGARPDIVRETARMLQTRWPDLVIAGARDGYFDETEESAVVDAIVQSGARLLFIGISSPKKELFLERCWARLPVAVAMGVGGSFDVLSGRLPRAPRWMRRAGMEWLFRLLLEPRRLGWRYVRTNAVYLVLLLLELGRPGRARRP